MKILLNTKKINAEINRLGWSKAKLANEMKISRQLLNYYFRTRSVYCAGKFGKALNLDPKDLVLIVQNRAA